MLRSSAPFASCEHRSILSRPQRIERLRRLEQPQSSAASASGPDGGRGQPKGVPWSNIRVLSSVPSDLVSAASSSRLESSKLQLFLQKLSRLQYLLHRDHNMNHLQQHFAWCTLDSITRSRYPPGRVKSKPLIVPPPPNSEQIEGKLISSSMVLPLTLVDLIKSPLWQIHWCGGAQVWPLTQF